MSGLSRAAGAAALVLVSHAIAGAQDAPDLIIHNARITTQVRRAGAPSAVAVKGERILAVGSDAAMLGLRAAATVVIDAQRRRLIPGLNDSHLHPTREARYYAAELRWDGVPTLAHALDMVRRAAEQTPAGQWVRVIGGWSPYQFAEKRMPTPDELTRAAPTTPVFVLHLYSGGIYNRRGVEVAGLQEATAPDGGTIERDADGRPTGRIFATPRPTILYQAVARLGELPVEAQDSSARHFYRELNRFGLTSAIDAGGGGHAYAKDVVAGRVVAGPLVRLACERHLRDLVQGPARGLRWAPDRATRVFEFFEEVLCLPEVDVIADPRPFALQPWQAFILGSLFGWLHAADNTRRFRVAYIEIGKGNGKSPLAAGIGLYLLVADGEPSAEVYTAATMREQARICWEDAERMVNASEYLSEFIDVQVSNLKFRPNGSFMRPVSSEAKGLDGKRVHGAILDEVHEHPTPTVVNKMRAGTKGRPQALIIEITNSGFDRTTICWQHHDYSEKLLKGVFENDAWFGYVCGLDEGDDFENPAVWPKANPNLGVSIQPRYLTEQIAEAKGIPAQEGTVKRLNFCIWTRAESSWVPYQDWQACGEWKVEDEDLYDVPAFGGIDLGQSDDFSAAVLIFPRVNDWVVRAWMWVPRATLALRQERPYEYWKKRGELIITGGNTTDLDQVEDDIVRLWAPFKVQSVGYDRRHASQLAQHLQDEHEYEMVDTPQGFFLNEAIRELEGRIRGHALHHGGHSLLTWMVDNVVIRQGRDGLKKMDREKSKDKIDGAVAMADAADRIIRQAGGGKSVLDSRGVREL